MAKNFGWPPFIYGSQSQFRVQPVYRAISNNDEAGVQYIHGFVLMNWALISRSE